jgi:hypothetical protein
MRNAEEFGVAVIFDRKKKIFELKEIKEEEELEKDIFCLSVPYRYLPKLPPSKLRINP